MSGEFDKVDPDAITIPENRIRKEFDKKHLEALCESIRVRGLIHPPVVTRRDLVLVAGECRLRCCRGLKRAGDPAFQSIPIQYSDEVDPKVLRAIELEENLKRKDITWQEEILGLADLVEYNEQELCLNKVQTAESIGYDKSTVSTKLKIARALQQGNPEVWAAESPRKAERIISLQKQDKDAHNADLLRDILADPELRAQILTKNFIEWTAEYRDPPFDVAHVDFPYGAGADSFGQGSGSVLGKYEDTPDVNAQLNEALFANLNRILAEKGHLIYWFWPPNYHKTRTMLEQHFDRVDPFTLTWHKTNGGTIRDPRFDPHQVKEEAFLCSRGGRRIYKANANVFDHPVPDNPLHMNEKPAAVLKHFLGIVVGEGSSVFDPTCGSGSSIRAAVLLGAYRVLGLEINPEFASRARLRLDEAMKASVDLEDLGL
jgi:DNA modification methylase